MVNKCCCCIPLRAGAFIVAAWFFASNLYFGIILFANGANTITEKVAGVIYLALALAGLYGVYGISKQIPSSVKWFTRFFLFNLIYFIVINIILIISLSMALNDCKKTYPNQTEICNNAFVSMIISFAIGLIIDIYLYIVLRSYSKELDEKSHSTSAPPTRNVNV